MRTSVAGQEAGYAEHIRDLINTHLPLFEMLVSRLISRNPQCCAKVDRLKNEQKPKKDKSTVFHLYKGIINVYAPEGWQPTNGGVITTPIIISLKSWFAEKIDILDFLSKHSALFSDFDATDDCIFITVVGATGLSVFQGIFIDYIKCKFKGFDMPWHIGLDTEVITNAQRFKRVQA